jgi:hypothetical protein
MANMMTEWTPWAALSGARCPHRRSGKRHPITMWFAPPRASRAPEYTAPKACGHVDECDEVERGMAEERSCLAPRREPLNVTRNSVNRTAERA